MFFSKKKKVKKFVQLLEEILVEVEHERSNPNNVWEISFLDDVVVREMSQLLNSSKRRIVYYERGTKRKMLHSTYHILDNPEQLGETILGQKILEVQLFYDKLISKGIFKYIIKISLK